MSREHFDVLVVGGGPSGSAAARSLAAAGRTVCLTDKATFPREKLCGGLITLRSKRIFDDIFESSWNDEIFNSSTDISFFSNGRFLANVEGYSRLFFTMRYDFDNYLLGLARAAGAHLKLGHTVSHFDPDRKLIALESGLEISFAHLVGADGVNSAVAKGLFGSSFNADTIGFGLEVEVPRSHLPAQSDHVEIDFSAAQWGYGWIFPKRNNFTIGVGGIHKFNPDLRLRLDQYLNHKGLAASEFKVKGHIFPSVTFENGRVPAMSCCAAMQPASSIPSPAKVSHMRCKVEGPRRAPSSMRIPARPEALLSSIQNSTTKSRLRSDRQISGGT
jgi:flavin-dependent dehydrogenase